jgi:hypothetical protein
MVGFAGAWVRRQRQDGVVVGFRLDPDHGCVGRQGRHGQVDPRDQPTARGSAHQLVEFQTARPRVLDDLQPRRALAFDDEGIVERADENAAPRSRDLLADGFAAFGVAVVGSHLAAV